MEKILIFLLCYNFLFASNHLKNETSPYLLQHKNNPVDWYPWGKEAFTKAKQEKKLIFLSIGYSTCHWCHVMAEESFTNKQVANILNKYYISIKVDREQYPQIDQYYQNIYRILNNKSGGWPLSIILTSDLKPIFAGTYIPKDSGYGSKGLVEILNILKNKNKKKLDQFGTKILNIVQQQNNLSYKPTQLDNKLIQKTISQFKSYYDFKHNGFSIKPKFPHSSSINILLDIYKITHNKDAYNMAINSLISMAKGGIYDQIEGGFYRYTTDKQWQIPHFEKMLYTNAELIETYTKAYKITNNKLFKTIVIDTIKQIDKRFKHNNLYISASNADSINFDGIDEEGFYFIYDYKSIVKYMQKYKIPNIKQSLEHFGIEEDGNIDGEFCNAYITNNYSNPTVSKVKQLLKQYRKQKQYPACDNKINTAWNALYIKSKLKASSFNKTFLKEGLISLDSLLSLMYQNNILYHQTIANKTPTQKALLEDYSFLSSALFQAYQLTLENKYLQLFEQIVKQSIKLFYINGKWYDSYDTFITYSTIDESNYKNALANLLNNIILLSTITSDTNLNNIVKTTLKQFGNQINNNPSYYPTIIKTTLLEQYQPLFVKSNKVNLKSVKLSKFHYPFIYKKVTNQNDFLICGLNSCIAYSKTIKTLYNKKL